MLKATQRAIAAMTWLEEADSASVELAYLYARQLDTLDGGGVEAGDGGPSAAYLGAQMRRILVDLGGMPDNEARKRGAEKMGGRLAHLRAVK